MLLHKTGRILNKGNIFFLATFLKGTSTAPRKEYNFDIMAYAVNIHQNSIDLEQLSELYICRPLHKLCDLTHVDKVI